MLSRLVWGPPYGQVTPNPAPRLRWLLDRGLLLPSPKLSAGLEQGRPPAPGTVVLPREAALHLRSGRAHHHTEPLPPVVEAAATHSAHMVDATAAGQAYTALATVEELLKDWDEGGPSVLRAGGLSVRDLKRTAWHWTCPSPWPPSGSNSATRRAYWRPTARRTSATPRLPRTTSGRSCPRRTLDPAGHGLADRDPHRGARRRPGREGPCAPALGPGLDRSAAPEVRHRVLTLLAGLPEGASAAQESVLARLRWERPLRGDRPAADDLRSRLAQWTLSEAELWASRAAAPCPGTAVPCSVSARTTPRPPSRPVRATSCPSTGSTTAPPRTSPSRPPNRRRPPPAPLVCSRPCSPNRWTTSCSRRT